MTLFGKAWYSTITAVLVTVVVALLLNLLSGCGRSITVSTGSDELSSDGKAFARALDEVIGTDIDDAMMFCDGWRSTPGPIYLKLTSVEGYPRLTRKEFDRIVTNFCEGK